MLLTFVGATVWFFMIMVVCHGLLFNCVERRQKWFWCSFGGLIAAWVSVYFFNTYFNIYQIDTEINRYVLFLVGWCFGLSTVLLYRKYKKISNEFKPLFQKYYMGRQLIIWAGWVFCYFYVGLSNGSILLTIVLWGCFSGIVIFLGKRTTIYKELKQQTTVQINIKPKNRRAIFDADKELQLKYEMRRQELEKRLKQLDDKRPIPVIFRFFAESIHFVGWLCGFVFGFIFVMTDWNTPPRVVILKPYCTKSTIERKYINKQLHYHSRLNDYFQTREEINSSREKKFIELAVHIGCSICLWGMILFLMMMTSQIKTSIGVPYEKYFSVIMLFLIGSCFFYWIWHRYAKSSKKIGIHISVWSWKQIFTRCQLTDLFWNLAVSGLIILTVFGFVSISGTPNYLVKTAQYSPIVQAVVSINHHFLTLFGIDSLSNESDYFVSQSNNYFITE